MSKYEIKYTTQFKKDYKLAKRRGLDITLLKDIVSKYNAEIESIKLVNRTEITTDECAALLILGPEKDYTEDEAKIISVLKGAYQLSSSEISKSSGFSRAKTIRLLNMLTEKNFVKCTGKGRGTKYQL